MNEEMKFPETFEQFIKEYGFKDNEEVYTNGSDLIQTFRVKQWLEHQMTVDKKDPCEDAISRQAVIDGINRYFHDDYYQRTSIQDCRDCLIEDVINELPSVNPQSRTGHWINVNEGKWNTIPAYKCSACGENADLRDWSGESPFCPWCGAKMVEPQESEVSE